MQKRVIQQVVAELPEQVDVDALIERMHLLDKIEVREQQIEMAREFHALLLRKG